MISDGGYLVEFFEDYLINDFKKDFIFDFKDYGCFDNIEFYGDLKVEEKEIQVDSIDNLLSKFEEDQGVEGKNLKEVGGDLNCDEGFIVILKEENEIVDVEGKERKIEMNEEERLEDVKVKDIKEIKQNYIFNLEEREVNNIIFIGENKINVKLNNIINIEIKNRVYFVNSNSLLVEFEIMDIIELKIVIKQELKQLVLEFFRFDFFRIFFKNRIVCIVEVYQ